MDVKIVLFIVGISLLFFTGVMLVLISSVQFKNMWTLFIVFIDAVAALFPMLCNGCNFGSSDLMFYGARSTSDSISEGMISWIFFGLFVTIGYAIPVELYRAGHLHATGVYLSISGSTIILIAAVVAARFYYLEKDDNYAYLT